MILDRIGDRVKITLSITIASRLVQSLSRLMDGGSLLKLTFVAVLLLALSVGREDRPKGLLQDAVGITRGLSVLVFVQIVLDELKPRWVCLLQSPQACRYKRNDWRAPSQR